MASLGRARFALPTQLAARFGFSGRFALCLPPAGAAGVVVFGDAPYAFQPGFELSDASLTYTPLLVNKLDEYFVGVTGIKVNGRAVPLNAALLAIDKKGVAGPSSAVLRREQGREHAPAPAVPTITLVLGSGDAASWVVSGANLMVATKKDE
ncbi:basic 7S globulin-like [Panicum miliaceum]|uniref:Basic 7S globulin-like n=1 Tax=Panicum miliaceum TaxID=4540 RepID=A0A3L6RCH8_PANMI|nr:basic 7S globulin-like [Panicum miliaceum]